MLLTAVKCSVKSCRAPEATILLDANIYEKAQRPHRHINPTLDGPFGGNFYEIHEPTSEGTRVKWRWEVEPQNILVGLLLPVMRPLLRWSLQRDLDTYVKKAASLQGVQPEAEDRQRQQAAASAARLARTLGWVSIGGGLAIVAVPGPLMKAFGLGERPNLGRCLGVRDLVICAGLLQGQNTAAWCRARGIADALDVALIIAGAATGAFRRDRSPIGIATGEGFSALGFWLVRQLEQ